MRKIPVYAHGANPAVDRPVRSFSRAHVAGLVKSGVAVMIVGMQAAKYIADRACHVEADRVAEIGYDRTVSYGRALVWVPSGFTWQMKPTYGSMARHFGRTRTGSLNCAPNKSTSPKEHAED